jgi:hypothetical protein
MFVYFVCCLLFVVCCLLFVVYVWSRKYGALKSHDSVSLLGSVKVLIGEVTMSRPRRTQVSLEDTLFTIVAAVWYEAPFSVGMIKTP